MRFIGYVRCSTTEQATEGVSLEAQRSSIEAYVKARDGELISVQVDEGISGGASIEKRPGLLSSIEAVKRGYVLVVVKRDRLARDAFLSAWIEKEVKRRGGKIVSLAGEGTENDDPSSLLMRRLVDAFSEYERAVIRARTKAAMRHKQFRNERVGSVPFGWDLAGDGRSLLPNTHEQSTITEILRWRAEGETLQGIADVLTGKGIRTKAGGRWAHETVRKILGREQRIAG